MNKKGLINISGVSESRCAPIIAPVSYTHLYIAQIFFFFYFLAFHPEISALEFVKSSHSRPPFLLNSMSLIGRCIRNMHLQFMEIIEKSAYHHYALSFSRLSIKMLSMLISLLTFLPQHILRRLFQITAFHIRRKSRL